MLAAETDLSSSVKSAELVFVDGLMVSAFLTRWLRRALLRGALLQRTTSAFLCYLKE